jgi:flagellar hook assembly protein FlgD
MDVQLSVADPKFLWRNADNLPGKAPAPVEYHLYLDEDSFFGSPQIFKQIMDTTFTVNSLSAGTTYHWTVLAANSIGDTLWSTEIFSFSVADTVTAIEDEFTGIPEKFSLIQNFPNPFNPVTIISYQLPKNSSVELTVYNTVGQPIRTLVNSNQSAGTYQLQWDGKNDKGVNVSTGLYFYRIKAGSFVQMKKMMLIK